MSLCYDMLIIVTKIQGINDTKKYLTSYFKMKDLGEVDTILAIKFKTGVWGFALCLPHYISKAILKFKHLDIKEFCFPFDVSSNVSNKVIENSGRVLSQKEYAV